MGEKLILIAVENKVNGQLLQDTLKQYHSVRLAESDADLNKPFDIGIFDGVCLRRLQKQVVANRDARPDIFLPVLLVTSRQDIGLVTRQLWQSIDEIIFAPIERVELLARVQVLVRAHDYSVELAELYQGAQEQATLDERQRLARELHDSVSQMLFSASMLSQSIPQLQKRNPERALEQLDEVAQLSRSALSEMRTLLLEMRPDNLVKASFNDLVDQLISAIQGRRHITIISNVENVTGLPDEIHIGLYRIVQEAFNNISKHSEATEVRIALAVEDGKLILDIQDNGAGFDPERHISGFGLENMRERAAQMGATLHVTSEKDIGTEIRVSLPLPQAVSIAS